MPSKDDANPVIGIPWYRREQWSLLRKHAADADMLEETYEEWRKAVRPAMLELATQGNRVERVDVDVRELIEWCQRQKIALDGSARAAFATEKLREKHHRGKES